MQLYIGSALNVRNRTWNTCNIKLWSVHMCILFVYLKKIVQNASLFAALPEMPLTVLCISQYTTNCLLLYGPKCHTFFLINVKSQFKKSSL